MFLQKPTHHRFVDLEGQIFKQLLVVAYAGQRAKRATWLCRCTCGDELIVSSSHLRGGIQSCGCLKRETARRRMPITCTPLGIKSQTKHGLARRGNKHPLYDRWVAMWQRCENPHSANYANYGQRGITVCDRWKDFTTYLTDVGEPPTTNHTLDRIDNGKGYDPGNIQWATPTQQANNRRPRGPNLHPYVRSRPLS